MSPPRSVAVFGDGGPAGDLARETLALLAQFGVGASPLAAAATPDPAVYAIAIVLGDRDRASRLAESFPGPVLLVPMGPDPVAVLEAIQAAPSADPQIPIGMLAAGVAGARNVALTAVAMLADSDPDLRARYQAFREEQTAKVLSSTLD